jgi:hypothetical protein
MTAGGGIRHGHQERRVLCPAAIPTRESYLWVQIDQRNPAARQPSTPISRAIVVLSAPPFVLRIKIVSIGMLFSVAQALLAMRAAITPTM